MYSSDKINYGLVVFGRTSKFQTLLVLWTTPKYLLISTPVRDLPAIKSPNTELGDFFWVNYFTSYRIHKSTHCVDLSDLEISQGDPNTNSSKIFPYKPTY